MHRAINFRAWNTTKKKMVESYAHIDKQGKLHGVFTYPDDKYIPLQNIGLKDKNGKEIYAKCDVLNCKSKDGFEHRDTVEFG